MSLSELLEPNLSHIFCDSLTLNKMYTTNSFSSFLQNNLAIASNPNHIPLIFNGVLISNPNYNSSTGVFTVPRSANYFFDSAIQFDSGANLGGAGIIALQLQFFINGAQDRFVDLEFSQAGAAHWLDNLGISLLRPCNAGDTIQLQYRFTTTTGGNTNFLNFNGSYFQMLQL